MMCCFYLFIVVFFLEGPQKRVDSKSSCTCTQKTDMSYVITSRSWNIHQLILLQCITSPPPIFIMYLFIVWVCACPHLYVHLWRYVGDLSNIHTPKRPGQCTTMRPKNQTFNQGWIYKHRQHQAVWWTLPWGDIHSHQNHPNLSSNFLTKSPDEVILVIPDITLILLNRPSLL